MWNYSLADLRVFLAQWDSALTNTDLTPCAAGGAIYNKALAEIQAAFLSAGYNPTSETPIALQLAKDLLIDGIAAYFIESRRSASYSDGYDPLTGLFSRYRRKLKDIQGGGQFGEFGQRRAQQLGIYYRGPVPSEWRGL